MNPYEESRLRTHRDDLARETRQLQLTGDSGAAPESEAEFFAFAIVRRVPSRIEAWLMAIVRWRPVGRRARSSIAAPAVLPGPEHTPAPRSR